MLYIVFDIDFLVKVLTDDQRQHRLNTANADEMLGYTVAAVLTGT